MFDLNEYRKKIINDPEESFVETLSQNISLKKGWSATCELFWCIIIFGN